MGDGLWQALAACLFLRHRANLVFASMLGRRTTYNVNKHIIIVNFTPQEVSRVVGIHVHVCHCTFPVHKRHCDMFTPHPQTATSSV